MRQHLYFRPSGGPRLSTFTVFTIQRLTSRDLVHHPSDSSPVRHRAFVLLGLMDGFRQNHTMRVTSAPAHCRLGDVDPHPGFHSRTRVYPPGLLATWTDSEKGYTFFSTISSGERASTAPAEATAKPAAPPAASAPDAGGQAPDGTGAEEANAGTPAVGKGDEGADGERVEKAAADAGGEAKAAGEGGGAGTAPDPSATPGDGAGAGEAGGGEAPEFRVRVKPCAAPKDAAEAEAALEGALAVGTSGKDPDAAWREAFALQRIALSLPRATADGGAAIAAAAAEHRSDADAARVAALQAQPALLDLLQQATLPPLHWGGLLFGLASVPVLQAIEGQAAVEQCTDYVYAEVRRLMRDARHVAIIDFEVK